MILTAQQKREKAEKMRAGKEAKQQARIEEEARKEKLLNDQATEIEALKVQLSQADVKVEGQIKSIHAEISDKNVDATAEFVKTGKPSEDIQIELDSLKQELADLKNVLQYSGSLPKKVATTQPWKSVGKPFHKDIFKTKKKHKGYELGFIDGEDLDMYLGDGYTVARGQDYGEKEGALERKRMIGVELPIETAEENREMLRRFNKAQRTSVLQKTKDMSDAISEVSGHKTKLKLGFE